ncbi:ATP-binding protein [Kitasatospora cinereorecta]|uniref:ATP-binding protein n=1 Tax=Kitasatospora cinereorecta TaxID=285560 RepID=A0ABW0VM66_9ACTN
MLVMKFSASVKHSSVGALRQQLNIELASAGIVLSEDEQFEARICLSELATNAINHGFGGELEDPSTKLIVTASVDRNAGRLRVAASDPGRGTPIERDSGLHASSGRGLALIRSYAAAFGWTPETNARGEVIGQQVWFELAIESLNGQATAGAAEVQLESRPDTGLQIASLLAASAVQAARPTVSVGSSRGAVTAA